MQDDMNTIEKEEKSNESSIDIKSLLEAANSSGFDESESLLREKDTFEKAESFFDLIKSDPVSETNDLLESDDISSENENEDEIEEEIGESLDDDNSGKNFEDGVPTEGKVNPTLEDTANSEETVSDKSVISDDVETENSKESETLNSDKEGDASFEAVDVVKEVLNTGDEDQSDESSQETPLEESADYQRGYQEALIEFENTLQVEKKAVADFGNTLFAVRDDLAKIIEETLTEKAKQICTRFLGDRIDEAPELLLNRINQVSSEIIEKIGEVIVELNEIDATAFIEKSSDLPFKVNTTTDLERGEFRIIAGKSGYHQTLVN